MSGMIREVKMKDIKICLLLISLYLFTGGSFAQTHKPLVLGVHPYKSVEKIQEAHTPLINYLSQKLATPVNLNISKDYQTHIDMIGQDKLDIAYMGPASYVAMVNKYGKKRIIARQVVNNKPTFRGNIIARADSGITKLTDLKGRRFAFGDPNSTMSHLVPRYMLIQNGITKDNLAEMNFLGSHDNVALSVLAGDYDAGAVKEAIYYKYRSKGLVSLAATPELSEHLFVASNQLPDKTFNKIQGLFLNMHTSDSGKLAIQSIKSTITSMDKAEDEDYQNLRKILSFLKEKSILK